MLCARNRLIQVLFFLLLAIPATAADRTVVISEFMAENNSGIQDADGDFSDWIELLNYGSVSQDITGCFLTDSPKNLAKWKINDVSLEPGEALLVFASGKDRTGEDGQRHTNFAIKSKGDYLALVDSDGKTVIHAYSPKYPRQKRNVSYGLAPNYWKSDPSLAESYFETPTPGASNGERILGHVEAVKLSHTRGLYDEPLELELKCGTADAMIKYTTDGSTPDSNNGTIYDSPISIDQSTVLRVMAFKPNHRASRIKTHSYILPKSVVRQSPDGLPPAGFPYSWGRNRVDYGMDPTIVDAPEYSETLLEGLRALPSFSIVMEMDDLFHEETGIYANAERDGREWERPCSIEMMRPDGEKGFQIDCGIRIRGGFSRMGRNPKHAFRLFFRKEYGPGQLEYALFGKLGTKKFDNLDLRTFQNYSWSFAADHRGIFLRDQFCRDLQLAVGQPAARGDFCHLYINGHYWGLFDTCERPKASYGSSYFEGKKADFDTIKQGRDNGLGVMASDGNLDAWRDQWELAHEGLESNEAYFKLMGRNPDGTRNPEFPVFLDPDNLIDYMLVIFYGGNLDAPVTRFAGNAYPNNWHGMRHRKGNEGFRYFIWDSEHTFLDVHEDRTGPFPAGEEYSTSNPQYIYQQCLFNAEFRLRTADRIYQHFYNGGVLTPESVAERFQARANQIENAVVCESARWGDASLGGRGFGVGGGGPRVDDDGQPIKGALGKRDWEREIRRILDDYIPIRTDIVLGQLYRHGVVLDVDPPRFNQFGGAVERGFALQLKADEGKVYFTTTGEDPRQIGGEVSTAAQEYESAVPVTGDVVVKARTLLDGEWSALAEAQFSSSK